MKQNKCSEELLIYAIGSMMRIPTFPTLKKILKRQKEHENRPLLIMEMKKMIGKYEKVEEKTWIEEEKRQLVLSKCTEADGWLANMIIKQEQLPLYENPFLTA